jgi:hypothetical protein
VPIGRLLNVKGVRVRYQDVVRRSRIPPADLGNDKADECTYSNRATETCALLIVIVVVTLGAPARKAKSVKTCRESAKFFKLNTTLADCRFLKCAFTGRLNFCIVLCAVFSDRIHDMGKSLRL